MIPAITPQIATRYTRSHSPPIRTQRTPVSQTHAAIAISSITPYMWRVSGPTWKTPFGGEGIAASALTAPVLLARSSLTMRFVDPGAIGECDGRTQGGSIAQLSGRPRTPQRAAERGRAAQRRIVG